MRTIACDGIAANSARLALLVLCGLVLPVPSAPAADFDVTLWPNGVVPYRFQQARFNDPLDCAADTPEAPKDKELCDVHKDRVRAMMNVWHDALQIADPTGNTVEYVRFLECTPGVDCPDSHVVVRYNFPREGNNMCTYWVGDDERVGRNPNGETTLHFTHHTIAMQPESVVLHELGHCLGMWHEQNREDGVRWLDQRATPVFCAANPNKCNANVWDLEPEPPTLEPMLGNYDYDSIMHYPSWITTRTGPGNDDVTRERAFTDAVGNDFLGDNWKPARPLIVSTRDVSRVLQYQAYEYDRRHGFFRSLNRMPADRDLLPNPYLDEANRVAAVGSPAIAHQSPGNYDVFARGSDLNLYWKSFRRYTEIVTSLDSMPHPVVRDVESNWQAIACCFASDPSAVSRGRGLIDVVAISNRGAVQRIKFADGEWAAPLTLRGGAPTGGIKYAGGWHYVAPAIASRAADLLDVFVVRGDGRLAVTTWRNGNWEAWQTLGITDYDVAARPAAVALSATKVQLAINTIKANGLAMYLYEPVVTFGGAQPAFDRGVLKGNVQEYSPPGLARQQGSWSRYRVLVTNFQGRVSVREEGGRWRDIGGIPRPGSGPAAVASGDDTYLTVMNGEDARGCSNRLCDTVHDPAAVPDAYIQPGGLWIRRFE